MMLSYEVGMCQQSCRCSVGECQRQNATNNWHRDGITRQFADDVVRELCNGRVLRQTEAMHSHEFRA